MQHYPAAWGHYDVCKSQIYTEEGLAWDYMACQPEATDMTKYLRVTLDPPNITCGDPPETYCALVSCNLASPMMETNEAVGGISQKILGQGQRATRTRQLAAAAAEIDAQSGEGGTLTSASTRTRYTQVQKWVLGHVRRWKGWCGKAFIDKNTHTHTTQVLYDVYVILEKSENFFF